MVKFGALVFLIIISSVVFVTLLIVRRFFKIFKAGKDVLKRQNQRQNKNNNTSQNQESSYSSKHFTKDEGKYVDYEDVE